MGRQSKSWAWLVPILIAAVQCGSDDSSGPGSGGSSGTDAGFDGKAAFGGTIGSGGVAGQAGASGSGGVAAGSGSGGAAGGSAGAAGSSSGAAGIGGWGDAATCDVLFLNLMLAINDATECDPNFGNSQCDGSVTIKNECGCLLVANNSTPTATKAADDAYAAWVAAGCGPYALTDPKCGSYVNSCSGGVAPACNGYFKQCQW